MYAMSKAEELRKNELEEESLKTTASVEIKQQTEWELDETDAMIIAIAESMEEEAKDQVEKANNDIAITLLS